jgi:hypothetical protein
MLSILLNTTDQILDRIIRSTAAVPNSDETKRLVAKRIHRKIKEFIIETFPDLSNNCNKITHESDDLDYDFHFLSDIWRTARGTLHFALETKINGASDFTDRQKMPEHINSKLVCAIHRKEYDNFETTAEFDMNYKPSEVFCVLPMKEGPYGRSHIHPFLLDDESIRHHISMNNVLAIRLNKFISLAVLEWRTIIFALCGVDEQWKYNNVRFEIIKDDDTMNRISYVIHADAEKSNSIKKSIKKSLGFERVFGAGNISFDIEPIENSPKGLIVTLIGKTKKGKTNQRVESLDSLNGRTIQEMLDANGFSQ